MERMMTDWTSAAFELFIQDRDDADILDHLLAAGCPRDLSEKLLLLIPLACSRAVLAGTGVSFSKSYRRSKPDGSVGAPISLGSEPAWIAIERFIAHQVGSSREVVGLIGIRSAEFAAINQAARKGSELTNLVTSDPIFSFSDALDAENGEGTPKTKQRWWAFWRKT